MSLDALVVVLLGAGATVSLAIGVLRARRAVKHLHERADAHRAEINGLRLELNALRNHVTASTTPRVPPTPFRTCGCACHGGRP